MEIISPPYSTDLERDVLSVMCNRPELIVRVEEILYSECFYDSDYQFLFDTIMDLHVSGIDITQSSILHKVIPSGKKDILGTYQKMKGSFTSDSTLWNNAVILAEYAVKRAILQKSYEIQAAIKTSDTLEHLDSIVNSTAEVMTTRNRSINASSFSESLDEMEVLMNRPYVNNLSGIDTGIPDLNEITSGWEEDDTVIIGGRPGMGKSLAGIFHAYHAALNGVPVAFISLEMSKAKLTSRIVSNVCNLPASDIFKGRLAPNQKRHVENMRKTIEKLPIYYYDNRNSWDVNDICLTMRNWKRKYGIGMIFIDYIQLARDRTVRDSSDSTKVITNVAQAFTHLKGTLRVPIIELAQLSRANEGRGDKRPTLSDLKGSGQLEQDASIVIFLYRQDYYDANRAREDNQDFIPTNDLEYIFAKNRAGDLGPVLLKADMRTNRIWSTS